MSAQIIELTPQPETIRRTPLGDKVMLLAVHESSSEQKTDSGIITSTPEAFTRMLRQYQCSVCEHTWKKVGVTPEDQCPRCEGALVVCEACNLHLPRLMKSRYGCPRCRANADRLIARQAPRGYINVANESAVGIKAKNSTSGDWYGWVVGVGAKAQGIAFGDLVYVSRWSGIEWWNYPATAQYANPLNPIQQIHAAGGERIAYLHTWELGYKVTDYAGWFGWPGGLAPGTHPIHSRVLLEHERAPRRWGAFIDPGMQKGLTRWARAVEVAPDVQDVQPGDRVLIDPEARHCRWETPDKRIMSTMVTEGILAVERDVQTQFEAVQA